MNLQDYFKHQQSSYMSEVDRFSIYQKILTKKDQKSLTRKKNVLRIKSLMYGFSLAILLFGVYGTYFFNSESRQDGLFVQNPLSNSVQAASIANVVRFQGDYKIENNGQIVQTSVIQDGDIITLEQGTEIIFNLDTETQAKIIWPAQFIVHKPDTDSYKLELMYGDFVSIQSLQDTNTQNLEIVSPDFVVHQSQSAEPIDFALVKDGTKHIIQNQGSDLLITTTNTDQAKQDTLITKKQQLTIDTSDITLLSVEDLSSAISQKNISQTFFFPQHPKPTTQERSWAEKTVRKMATKDIQKELATQDIIIDPGVMDEIAIFTTQEKQILTPAQNNKLISTLAASFLASDLQKLFTAYTEANTSATELALGNIDRKISQLCSIFDLSCTQSSGISTARFTHLQSQITKLITHLEPNYLVPPRYIHNLHTTAQWLTTISTYTFGQHTTDTNISRSDISSKINFQ